MALAPKSFKGFAASFVSWGTVETMPKSIPGMSGTPYLPPVATTMASGAMLHTSSCVTSVFILIVSPGVFFAWPVSQSMRAGTFSHTVPLTMVARLSSSARMDSFSHSVTS